MASSKLKTFVSLNGDPENFDITLTLTADQAVEILNRIAAGAEVYVNLKTPTANGHVRENPAAYAE